MHADTCFADRIRDMGSMLSTESEPRSAFDQVMEPLSVVAASFADVDCENVTLLAWRPALEPYAFALTIPAPGQPSHLRERGLELLMARAVTIACAIVGTSRLSVVCEHDATFEALNASFGAHPHVTSHLKQYGSEFELRRAQAGDIPETMRALPFAAAPSKLAGHTVTDPAAVEIYVGVDYGRSDVKCAAVDASGREVATYVTRWWRAPGLASSAWADEQSREYVDPASLETIEAPLRCLGEAAIEVVRLAAVALGGGAAEGDGQPGAPPPTVRVCGLGLSAAGCVLDGHICGVPPAFGGCSAAAAAPVLGQLENEVVDYVMAQLSARLAGWAGGSVAPSAPTLLVNDGDASAMWGARTLAARGGSDAVGLFLSCGTGLAGGIVRGSGERCVGGVFEMGKVVVGLPSLSSAAVGANGQRLPQHDTLHVPGTAQGLSGTQRAFFNLLEARGGQRVEGKAEQRRAIVAMQARALDAEVRAIFEQLGGALALFVAELSAYLPFAITHVEAGGKLTDAASGEVMMQSAARRLAPQGVDVARASDSEFGQALAMAESVRGGGSRAAGA